VSEATGVNDAGTVVGYSFDASNIQHAVQWTRDAAGTWNISRLPSSANAGAESNNATAISNSGRLAGVGCANLTPTGCTAGSRAYVWTSTSSAATVLGTLGGRISAAYGIDDLGNVAGWSSTSTGSQHAFFATAGGGPLRDLGALKGGTSTAAGVADHVVVGTSDVASGRATVNHATVWIVP
jgi:probable HAF family extracellular repeat protein